MTPTDTNVAAYPVQDGTGQDMQFVCGRVTLGTAATFRASPAHSRAILRACAT